MDHVLSSLILFFPPCLDPLRPEARGSLESCHVTFGCQRCVTRSKKRGPHFTDMQKSSAITHNIQRQHRFFSQAAVSGFGCSHRAAGHQLPAQGDALEQARPRRATGLNPGVAESGEIFPWMTESRTSDQKHGRRAAGVYDAEKRPEMFFKLRPFH